MHIGSFNVIAPALGAPGHSLEEAFGQVVCLWMQTARHRDLPLKTLSSVVLPPLNAQQFIVASAWREGRMQPVAYIAWANFSVDAERRYLQQPESIVAADWSSGDRMWVTEWFTPFGHAAEFKRLVKHLLPDTCFRALDHRGDERGFRIIHFRGARVSFSQNRAWWDARPLPTSSSSPELPQDALQ